MKKIMVYILNMSYVVCFILQNLDVKLQLCVEK
jgi:hypothetical protein